VIAFNVTLRKLLGCVSTCDCFQCDNTWNTWAVYLPVIAFNVTIRKPLGMCIYLRLLSMWQYVTYLGCVSTCDCFQCDNTLHTWVVYLPVIAFNVTIRKTLGLCIYLWLLSMWQYVKYLGCVSICDCFNVTIRKLLGLCIYLWLLSMWHYVNFLGCVSTCDCFQCDNT